MQDRLAKARWLRFFISVGRSEAPPQSRSLRASRLQAGRHMDRDRRRPQRQREISRERVENKAEGRFEYHNARSNNAGGRPRVPPLGLIANHREKWKR